MDLIRKILNLLRKSKLEVELSSSELDISEREDLVKRVKLAKSLEKNINLVKEAMGNSLDLTVRSLKVGPKEVAAAAVYLDGMVDNKDVEEVLRDLTVNLSLSKVEANSPAEVYAAARDRLLTVVELRESDRLEQVIVDITRGVTALLIEDNATALLCGTRGWKVRSVEQPATEISLRGPREGFVENIRTNVSMLRRRLHTPNLWVEQLEAGELTRTQLALVYIKGLAEEKVVEEVRSRLQAIKIDGILESGYIEDFLQSQPFTVFPLMMRTERPDRVAAALLEGRVAVITDGTPFVLLMPVHFSMFFQAPEDYYESFYVSSLIRVLRYLAFFSALFLPALYVAIINFHPELLPTVLFLRITAAREGVPFPAAVEALLMEGVFEVLREAGLRLPPAVGQAISIVGALVLGDAAIRAGLVSPGVVIVVALTAITSFTVPSYSMGIAGRSLRFLFILVGAVFGLFGIQFGVLLLIIHLCSLRSFGLPYMYPFGPTSFSDMRDTILRLPWWTLTGRPRLIGRREPDRQPPRQRPGKRTKPDEGKEE